MAVPLLLICAAGLLLRVVAGDATSDIFASIETQDVSGMKSALASGADINTKGPGGQGGNSIEQFWLAKPLPYTNKKVQNWVV